jgi:hypothetical protein
LLQHLGGAAVTSARADFPNLAGAGGNVQVTSYGSGSDRCKVASWGTGALATTLRVNVRCHTVGGAPVNTYFVALSSRLGHPGERAALRLSRQPGQQPVHEYVSRRRDVHALLSER